jgi:hypothetical protein
MANIKTSKSEHKPKKVIVIPRSNETYKERFAIANGKRAPFETPTVLSENDIRAIKNQKEPIKTTGSETVYDIMEKLQVDQKKAAAILANKRANDMDSRISWKQKYIVQYV